MWNQESASAVTRPFAENTDRLELNEWLVLCPSTENSVIGVVTAALRTNRELPVHTIINFSSDHHDEIAGQE